MPAVAALSTKLSTAALDKHPQSKERGITLDLGFSAFVTDLPPQLQGGKYKALQVTHCKLTHAVHAKLEPLACR